MERLRSKWRPGDKDVARRRSPYLVAWKDLTEAVKKWDRVPVQEIPALLARVGLAIRRTEK